VTVWSSARVQLTFVGGAISTCGAGFGAPAASIGSEGGAARRAVEVGAALAFVSVACMSQHHTVLLFSGLRLWVGSKYVTAGGA
jgi:hypothetical protein